MFIVVVIVLVIKLVNVVGCAMGIVPDELLWFEELTGFEGRFGFVHLDLVR
jgi:hypothetical protein